MVETKTTIIGVLIALLTVSIGGIVYTTTVYDSGIEVTCGTNKPTGWNILVEHENYVEAICPYTTKEPVKMNCTSFRSTASYTRYGCNKAIVVIDAENNPTPPSPTEPIKVIDGYIPPSAKGTTKCYPHGCVNIE